MSRTTSRVLWVIAGVLLVIAGIACLRDPGAAFTSMTVILGIAMLFSGIVDIVIFATAHNYMAGSGWFLLDGILTVYGAYPAVHFWNVADFFRHNQIRELL